MVKKVIAAIALLAILLVGQFSFAASTPSTLDGYYKQSVNWKGCGTDLYCGTIKVPLNYKKVDGKSVNIAVVYHRAKAAKPLGFLLMNPGGPGSSGFDYVKNNTDAIGTDKLRAQYNLVGFDPRGVQNSSAVSCFTDKQLDNYLYGDSGFKLGTSQDLTYSKRLASNFARSCQKNTGDLLRYVDTISAARDMDVIRAVLGDPKLNYLGFSYGTFLGATYASLFPTKVGRMVLDGAINPKVSDEDQLINQITGFDNALKAYLTDCLKQSGCPFTGSVASAQKKIASFLLGLETKPINNTDDSRKVTVWAANTGIIMALYSEEYWEYLTEAFKTAFKGDGTTLMRLADFYNDRQPDGTYATNITEANIAISCLDSRPSASMTAMKKQNARLLKVSPTLGRYWQFGAIGCGAWPYPAVKPLKSYAAKGAPTIMVIGTTGDPATPYQQAVDLAHKILAKGYLVTYKGEGHTAYGRSNSCVDNAVDEFFIRGTTASKEPVC